MSNAIVNSAKSTHYTVSTFAAVIYALIWMLANNAHAETQTAHAVLPEITIVGYRETSPSELPEIVVRGKRAVLDEVVVYGKRENISDERVSATDATRNAPTLAASAKTSDLWITKVRHWLQNALLQ